eukprot:13793997-Alexandrium_andersonii.AAC.1
MPLSRRTIGVLSRYALPLRRVRPLQGPRPGGASPLCTWACGGAAPCAWPLHDLALRPLGYCGASCWHSHF